jgi:CpXC protein
MSKRVDANIFCPHCNIKFKFSLFRTIWGEYPEYRELVMTDMINVATCPQCSRKLRANYPFMYTNKDKTFAVWYEPVYDSRIDDDTKVYKEMAGADSYFATAPRIKNWNEFKETIIKFEKGILKGEPAKRPNF